MDVVDHHYNIMLYYTLKNKSLYYKNDKYLMIKKHIPFLAILNKYNDQIRDVLRNGQIQIQ